MSLIVLFGVGAISGTTAEAQGRGHDWNQGAHGNWGQERRFGFTDPRTIVRPRVFVAPVRPRVFVGPRIVPRVYAYPGPYSYSAPYSYNYYGNAYAGSDQQGYHDGYDRGREDARDGRGFNPNNSSHFRDSFSAAYRDGFRRGYDAGYRSEVGYRRW